MLEELNKKRLLVLGGSAWLDIIREFATENGISLVAVGNNPNSPLSKLDEYYDVDSTNHEAMKKLIVEKKIDGVYLGSNEKVIRHALQYLEELGLPTYCKLDQWDILMDKGKFKKLCNQFDIPVVPRYQYSPGMRCDFGFPVITKPSDGCASLGVTICNNEKELKKGYELAYNNSVSGDVIVEKLVKNKGLDVFFLITNGQIEFCIIGDKYPVKFSGESGSVAGARILPSKVNEEFYKKFDSRIENMLKSIGLYQGLIWMEVFKDGPDYFFNEVGYRPNGSLSIVGIDYFCNVNTVAEDIYFSLTGKGRKDGFSSLILKEKILRKRQVCEYWVASRPGVIGEIFGLEEVYKHPNVLALFPKYDVNGVVPDTKGFDQNFCVIHFVFDSAIELKKIIEFIEETINMNDIDGNDMIIHKDEQFIQTIMQDYVFEVIL